MKRVPPALLLGLLIGVLAIPAADAAIRFTLAPNFDSTRTTAYENGDKPLVGCTPPTGFTELNVGTGAGEICEQSATEFDFAVNGESQAQNNHLAYKDGGGADVQIKARITDSYTGSTENNATIGLGIRETTAQDSWLMQVHSLQSGPTAVQCTHGAGGSYTSVNGGVGTSRPRYVAITYDNSANDVRAHASDDGITWVEVCQVTRDLTNDLGYMFGTSRVLTSTLQATIDNFSFSSTINVYTPVDPPDEDAPTLVTPIDNQSLAQGSSFSLSCAANFLGATSYSVSGLPSGTGLSFNTSTCAFSGAPDVDDANASPYNVTVNAINAFGTLPEVVQFSVTGVPGDVFTIPTSGTNRTFNCSSNTGAATANWSTIRTSGTGARPQDGDTIVISGGTHGNIKFQDCVGSPSSYLLVRNDIADNEPALIEGGGNFYLELTDVHYFKITGLGKYNGAAAGTPGRTCSGTACTENRTSHGIVVTNGGANQPNSFVKVNGDSSDFIVEGIEAGAAANTGSGVGLCFSVNDNNVPSSVGFRENFQILNNYAHNCGSSIGECYYIGPNGTQGGMNLRNYEIAYNLCDNSTRDCYTVKSASTGANSIHHNGAYNCALSGENNQDEGFSLQTVGNIDIYANWIEDPAGPCIKLVMSIPPAGADRYVRIYNNMCVRAGRVAARTGDGVRIQRQDAGYEYNPLLIYNNTIIDPDDDGVNCESNVTGTARDNIITTAGGTAVSGCTNTNNRTGTIVSQAFAGAGADNYELTSLSPACNQSSSNAPATDYEDEARPQDSADDQGADEAASCP